MAAPEGMFVLEGRPTAQLIADQLRELIVQGAFRPGQQVNESALASQLSTSRGPLREALQRLCQEGILVSKRNRGVFVLELSTQDVKEIYAVREAVELAAANTLLDSDAEQVADTCRELKGIIRNMAKQVAASDWQAIARLDMQFHTAFVSGTGNTRLIRIYETLAAESRMCILSLEVAYPRIDALVQEHQQLLDLLEARDRSGLQQAIKRHMQKAVQDLTSSPEVTGITA
ncbi:GntR family transcriptional regulator [Paenarthrobacter sp. 2TAF44]|uniref:GntR family transcriptional regulator n=1 Tax=Paenarthrobacter sp. 2TAF44 TaxID=3233018 RepID=UPI003F9A9BFF